MPGSMFEAIQQFWGGPAEYSLGAWLFVRLMGLVYLSAFVSLGVQITGLVGERGILPIGPLLAKHRARLGRGRFWQLPTLCWWRSDDRFLRAQCWAGAALALLLLAGVLPVPAAVGCWALYLSLSVSVPVFLSFQWDILLLEMGFLTVFFAPLEVLPSGPWSAPAPPQITLLLLWWLLFRLMFCSGLCKLKASNPAWRDLSAMSYHYWTQPLPTRWAWWADKLPNGWHRFETAATLAVEFALPFLLLVPSPGPQIAAAGFIGLMLLIQWTGNYCFFNLQAVALSLVVIPDRMWAWLLGGAGLDVSPLREPAASLWPWWLLAPIALVLVILSLIATSRMVAPRVRWPKPLTDLHGRLAPLRLTAVYGLFANMTLSRPEIVIEGSADGEHWHAYRFRWKPGDVRKPPRRCAPHQPRLDWQMWFAALAGYQMTPWFPAFMQRLLENEPAVLKLLAHNPFPDAPPQYLRAVLYEYRFTDLKTGFREGRWWSCEYQGLYCPVLSLRGPVQGLGSIIA